jgi:hypothetical protein
MAIGVFFFFFFLTHLPKKENTYDFLVSTFQEYIWVHPNFKLISLLQTDLFHLVYAPALNYLREPYRYFFSLKYS